jgi:demethylmenaquinone methyltransferase / 2-methoxy-6-polyprenyl-1,4-benzoquinol methylase
MSFSDSASVRSMFGRIARRYDAANHLLSAGCDLAWRRRLVSAVCRTAPAKILDLATGSGDVAFALSRKAPAADITGMDFCPPMLAEAERKKAAAAGSHGNIRFLPGDALALPLPNASFDAVTLAFGLRNMADRRRSLEEVRRVLRPGGRLFVLEFSQPQHWFRPFYFLYLETLLPAAAGLVTGDRAAYVYLNRTIREFPGRESLAGEMRAAGFSDVSSTAMTFGVVALHQARK